MIIGIGGISIPKACQASGKPWTPAAITTSLWLDASDTSTVTLNGSDVSQWNDKSGNNKNAAQSTAAKQPAYSSNQLNGYHGIVFNGTSDCLRIPSISLNTFTTVFFVMKNPSGGAFFIEHSQNASNFDGFYIYGNQGNSAHTRRAGTTNAGNFATGYWTGTSDVIITINTVSNPSVAADIFRPFKDGTAVTRNVTAATTLTNSSVTTALNIGARDNGTVAFFNGNLYELIICNSSLSASDQEKVEGYLAWKWGLQNNLPVTHPYKSAAP